MMLLEIYYNHRPVSLQDLYEETTRKHRIRPPEGMSAHDIKLMSDNDLLDMDYFLHEFDDDDDFSEEGFHLF